jgi:hypothetical protein
VDTAGGERGTDDDVSGVMRVDQLDLLRDALENRLGLDAAHEGQDVGLHDTHLRARPLIHGIDILDRPLRRVDALPGESVADSRDGRADALPTAMVVTQETGRWGILNP